MHAVDADQQHPLDAAAAKTPISIGMCRQTRRSCQEPGPDSGAFQEFPHNLSLILDKRRGRYAGLVKLERQIDCTFMTSRARLSVPNDPCNRAEIGDRELL